MWRDISDWIFGATLFFFLVALPIIGLVVRIIWG